MAGVKELKDSLIAIVALGKAVAEAGKGGFDLGDLGSLVSKFVSDEAFRGKLDAGVKGIEQVGVELSDIDAAEALEVITAVLVELRSK